MARTVVDNMVALLKTGAGVKSVLVAAPLLLGGAFLAVSAAQGFAASRRESTRRLLRRNFPHGMVGESRDRIASLLGPPRGAGVPGNLAYSPDRHDALPEQIFQSADTWYYLLQTRHQAALAVMFEGDRVKDTAILHYVR